VSKPDLDELALARYADDGGTADVAVPGRRRWAQPRKPSVRKRPRRRQRPRARTLARVSKRDLQAGALEFPPVDEQRPRTRGECRGQERPCPWVACKYSLYLDVWPETGTIRLNFPDLEPDEMKESCALDVAERGEATQDEVGDLLNVTHEGARLVEIRALLKIKMASPGPDEPGAALVQIRKRPR
jgi:hypothetical protein